MKELAGHASFSITLIISFLLLTQGFFYLFDSLQKKILFTIRCQVRVAMDRLSNDPPLAILTTKTPTWPCVSSAFDCVAVVVLNGDESSTKQDQNQTPKGPARV